MSKNISCPTKIKLLRARIFNHEKFADKCWNIQTKPIEGLELSKFSHNLDLKNFENDTNTPNQDEFNKKMSEAGTW